MICKLLLILNTLPHICLANYKMQEFYGTGYLRHQGTCSRSKKMRDNRGIRTLASEEIGTLILRLRPTRPDCLSILRQPGVEPGARRWQRRILPLNH